MSTATHTCYMYVHVKENNLKAVLHCAIFSATCFAMVENVTLQVAEVWR